MAHQAPVGSLNLCQRGWAARVRVVEGFQGGIKACSFTRSLTLLVFFCDQLRDARWISRMERSVDGRFGFVWILGLAECWEGFIYDLGWNWGGVGGVVGSSGAHSPKMLTGIREFCSGIVPYDIIYHIAPDQK